jgi:hypothetical protein
MVNPGPCSVIVQPLQMFLGPQVFNLGDLESSALSSQFESRFSQLQAFKFNPSTAPKPHGICPQ